MHTYVCMHIQYTYVQVHGKYSVIILHDGLSATHIQNIRASIGAEISLLFEFVALLEGAEEWLEGGEVGRGVEDFFGGGGGLRESREYS